MAAADGGGGWIGRSFTWAQPIRSTDGAAISARLASAGGGLWHIDLFLAPGLPDDAVEGQPRNCLRLGVRAGVPVVERLDDGPDVREPLWQGSALSTGPHTLQLIVQGGGVLARLDGRTVWQGASPYPMVHAGLRFSRRVAGTEPAVVDGIELAPP